MIFCPVCEANMVKEHALDKKDEMGDQYDGLVEYANLIEEE